MFRVEISKAFHRPRTYVLGVLLAAVAVLPVVVLATSPGGGGPTFSDFLTRSGLYAPLIALALMQPFILPLGAGLLAGESVAAEASGGTLRALLVRPVERTRLVGSKFAAVVALLGLAVLWIVLVAGIAGVIAFGAHAMPTLSGSTLGVGTGLARVALAAVYALAGVAALAAIGMLISVSTDSAPVATVAIVGLVIAFQILDGLSSLHAIHPYLLTHDWLAYADLFRSPVAWDALAHGAAVFCAYTVVFLSAALLVFRAKDVDA